MEPIRILHVIGAMNRGGAETLVMELYRHIDRTKVQFDFMVYNYSDEPGVFDSEILDMGGKIYNAKQRFYRNPIAYSKELLEFFKNHPEYKIVHAHLNAMSGFVVNSARKAGVSVRIAHSHAAFSHHSFLRRHVHKIGKLFIKKDAEYIFGCSENALVSLSGSGEDKKTRFVVNNAIDTDRFYFSKVKRDYWRKELDISDDTKVYGYVARLSGEKNHTFLLEIFSKILEYEPNSLLELIGTGPLLNELKNKAKELNIDNKVIFLGSRSDVSDIENSFDTFVMPSMSEGLGIVIIEAQANGIPCVISADVIPEEADVHAGLVTRVSLDDSDEIWAKACLEAGERIDPDTAKNAVIKAGYDINEVATWLENFYLENWNR